MQTEAGTKARLLEAGRTIFAEHGPAEARIRDICALARTNVAAVHYHFGSKEKFYIMVLAEHMRLVGERYPLDQGLSPDSTPQDRLGAFVRGLLRQLLAEGDAHSARLGRLVLLEMLMPSQHVGVLIEKHLRPLLERLKAIVQGFFPGVSQDLVARCTGSIVAQFAVFPFDPAVLESMGLEFSLRQDSFERVAEAVIEFSLGGIERLRARSREI